MIFLTYPSPIQQSARIRNFGPYDYNPELTNTKINFTWLSLSAFCCSYFFECSRRDRLWRLKRISILHIHILYNSKILHYDQLPLFCISISSCSEAPGSASCSSVTFPSFPPTIVWILLLGTFPTFPSHWSSEYLIIISSLLCFIFFLFGWF